MIKRKNKGSVLTDIAIVPREPEFPVDPVNDLTATGPVRDESNDAGFTRLSDGEFFTPAEHALSIDEKPQLVGKFTFGTAPVPSKGGRKAILSYPIASLYPDSDEYFDVPLDPSVTKGHKQVAASIRMFAYRNGLAVILRELPEAVRVWRKSAKRVKAEK